jgi:hypothetical protein
MTGAAESVTAPVRRRDVTWEDPLVGAALARDLSGQVVSAGRRVITASGQITGPDGRLYAHATTTCLLLDARSGGGSQARPATGLNGSQQPQGDNGDER